MIAARLAPLGAGFHGAPVVQTVDGLAAFDAATDRAATAAAANRLWAEGCGEPACRAAMLEAAVRVALGGAPAASGPQAAKFERRVAARWPEGLGAASPDLPNRDPLLQDDPGDLETEGALDPETPREPLRAVAARGRLRWRRPARRGAVHRGRRRLDRRPRAAGSAPAETVALDCEAGAGRFRCVGPGRGASPGWSTPAASRGCGGSRSTACRRSAGSPGSGCRTDASRALRLAGDRATLSLSDDLAPLGAALAARAEAGAPALGDGPFRRRAVLALIGGLPGGGEWMRANPAAGCGAGSPGSGWSCWSRWSWAAATSPGG